MHWPAHPKISQVFRCHSTNAFILAFLFLFLNTSHAMAAVVVPEKISFENILENKDISLGDVAALFQDSEGYMWFGGSNALIRYDGYDTREFGISTSSNALDEKRPVKFVTDIFEDSQHKLWIATRNGLFQFDSTSERLLQVKDDDTQTAKISIANFRRVIELPNGDILACSVSGLFLLNAKTHKYSVITDDETRDDWLKSAGVNAAYLDGDVVWLGTELGLEKFDWRNKTFMLYKPFPEQPDLISNNRVRDIVPDGAGKLWVATSNGLILFDPKTQQTKRYVNDPTDRFSISNNDIWRLLVDAQGVLWIASDGGGVSVFNSADEHFINHKFKAGTIGTISSNQVRVLFEDRSGDIWTGNYPVGINYFNRASAAILSYTSDIDNPKSLSHNSVLSVAEDALGNLWIGTDGGGLNYLDRQTEEFTQFRNAPDNPASIINNSILATFIDSAGIVWLGTWGSGIASYDPSDKSFTNYPFDAEQKNGPSTYTASALNDGYVWSIREDKNHNLWISTHAGGISKFNRNTKLFTYYKHSANTPDSLTGNLVWSTFEDSHGNFWVATNTGLNLMNRKKGTFKHYLANPDDPTSLSNNSVLVMFEDRNKRLWLGTDAGLNLFNPSTKNFTVFNKKDGLTDDTIRSIVEDADGSLWLGTNNGFSSFNPASKKVKNYSRISGKLIGGFSTRAGVRSSHQEIILGGVNGLKIFNPKALIENKTIPPVVLTDFKIFSDRINVNGADGILQHSVNHTDTIILDHTKSMFTFSFSALNFRDADKNRYSYQLEGFDKSWLDAGSQRLAKYTNLNPGKYTFKVKASNNDGRWNEQGKSITIIQLPPPWKTWWAYLIYMLSVAFIVFYYVHSQHIKIAHEKAINTQLRYLDKLKDDFLANTSHELRTPLNGIIGLSQSLIDGAAGAVSKEMKSNLQMISISGKRLASLVNDILDFSRLKNRAIDLNRKPLNLRHFVDAVTTMSRPLIGQKDLDLTNTVDEMLPAIYADENRLQQILFNLIGNAIKFTESGLITLSAEYKDERIWVHVQDTGIGIAPDMFERIFESFEQVESHEDRKYGGTGLGLAVTKQLVELHGGTLQVTSQLGQGSTFSFCMPSTGQKAQQTDSELLSSLMLATEHAYVEPAIATTISESSQPLLIPSRARRDVNILMNAKFKILIVDDEPINRQVLQNHLQLEGYQFAEAASGIEALEAIEKKGPFDLILLDIMMPRMSGYEVCTKIRKRFTALELPIIFLTAKNLIADLVSGFDVGANDFLTKPIAKGELLSRVKTHLELLDISRNLDEKIRARTQELDRTNHILETLDGIVATINQEVIHERLLDVLLQGAKQLFPEADHAIYWNYNRAENIYFGSITQNAITSAPANIEMERTLLFDRYQHESQKIGSGVYLLKPNQATSGANEFFLAFAPTAELILTIEFDDTTLGFLSLLSSRSPNAFDAVDIQTAERFRAHTMSALLKARLVEELKIKNEKLENLSLTDQLTGLRNRHYLTKFLDSDIALTLRSHSGQPALARSPENSNLLFFMLDIDFFKAVNDKYGHSAGDQILMNMKPILETIFRNSDFLIRWGGEEFLVVSRFGSRDAAPVLAERLRAAVENFSFTLSNGTAIKKTCSIGFACFPYLVGSPQSLSWMQVVDIADRCLYAAKKSQRNCWVGLEANLMQEKELTFHNIISEPGRLVAENALIVHSSIPTDRPIVW